MSDIKEKIEEYINELEKQITVGGMAALKQVRDDLQMICKIQNN